MKSLMIAAASAAAAVTLASPAFAQGSSTFEPITPYATLGYAGSSWAGLHLGAIQGRLGAQFGKYIAVEGELAGGVKSDTVAGEEFKLRHQEAIYAVGILPLSPNVDLFARVGYGHSNIGVTGAGNAGEDSYNLGAGGQYFFTAKDGIRAEFTAHDFRHDAGTAKVWSVAYVRKF